MFTYHVYFTAKENYSHDEVIVIIDRFAEYEMKENLLESYELFRFTNKAAFPDLLDYHFTANYRSREDQSQAMRNLGPRYKEEPHASLMKMSESFGVAFSERIERKRSAEPDVAHNSGGCAPSA